MVHFSDNREDVLKLFLLQILGATYVLEKSCDCHYNLNTTTASPGTVMTCKSRQSQRYKTQVEL
eukprot:6211437-Amphidinium_carterae.1